VSRKAHRESTKPARRRRRHANMVTGGIAARLLCACEVALTRDSLDSRASRKNDE
jgi:hypothetical protein